MFSSCWHKVSPWVTNNISAGKELEQVLTHLLLNDLVSVTEHVQGGDADTLPSFLQGLKVCPVLQGARNKASNKNAEPEYYKILLKKLKVWNLLEAWVKFASLLENTQVSCQSSPLGESKDPIIFSTINTFLKSFFNSFDTLTKA